MERNTAGGGLLPLLLSVLGKFVPHLHINVTPKGEERGGIFLLLLLLISSPLLSVFINAFFITKHLWILYFPCIISLKQLLQNKITWNIKWFSFLIFHIIGMRAFTLSVYLYIFLAFHSLITCSVAIFILTFHVISCLFALNNLPAQSSS